MELPDLRQRVLKCFGGSSTCRWVEGFICCHGVVGCAPRWAMSGGQRRIRGGSRATREVRLISYHVSLSDELHILCPWEWFLVIVFDIQEQGHDLDGPCSQPSSEAGQ